MTRKGKARQEREDAAYLANLQQHFDLSDAGAETLAGAERFATVPNDCPSCGKRMGLASGWALLFGDLLQCGECSLVVSVPRDVHVEYGRKLHQYFERLQALPKPKREPRTRGAG